MGSLTSSGRKVAGLAGVLFAVLFVAAFALGDAPTYDDPVSEYRTFFVDEDTSIHLITWLGSLATVFLFLPFAAGLRNLLAGAEGDGGAMWSRLSYTGAVLTTAIAVIGFSFWEVLSQGVAEGLSDDALVALARFDTVIFLSLMPWGLALLLGAAAYVILQTGVLARWIGWLGAAGALFLVAGTLWMFGEDDGSALAMASGIAQLVPLLWILIVGVKMMQETEPAVPLDREMAGTTV